MKLRTTAALASFLILISFLIAAGSGLSTASADSNHDAANAPRVEVGNIEVDKRFIAAINAKKNLDTGDDDWRLMSYLVFTSAHKGGPSLDSFDVPSLEVCRSLANGILKLLSYREDRSAVLCLNKSTGEVRKITVR